MTSVIFAIAHGDAPRVAAALVLGLYFAWLREVTGGVRACIAAHSATNLVWWLSVQLPLQLPGPELLAPVSGFLTVAVLVAAARR